VFENGVHGGGGGGFSVLFGLGAVWLLLSFSAILCYGCFF
jgi:hypothetical protein